MRKFMPGDRVTINYRSPDTLGWPGTPFEMRSLDHRAVKYGTVQTDPPVPQPPTLAYCVLVDGYGRWWCHEHWLEHETAPW